MIILTQDGENVITLKEIFRIDIHPMFSSYENLFSSKIEGYYIKLEQDDTIENIGEYENIESAKRVVKNLVQAYSDHQMAFVMP